MQPVSSVQERYFLFPSSLHVVTEPTEIQTVLGSCVAVCLYDKVRRFGGMNHYMLPLWKGEGLATPKFGDISIEKLIARMLSMEGEKRNIVAKVFGGAEQYVDGSIYEIGKRNIEVAVSILGDHGITIVGSSTGGRVGRRILFHSASGQVLMKYLNGQSTEN